MKLAKLGGAALLMIVVSMGCGRDNGLPEDIISHLAASGITVEPSRVYAPLSGRDGYVVVKYDAQTAAKIASVFSLDVIQANAPQREFAIERTGGVVTPDELWGVSGRPAQFKLNNGGQLEYFYLLVTSDGWMYLLAEYAYG